MKKLFFNRKRLLHAIHAACVALFLLAAAQKAQAQMSSPPFQISGSTVTTSAGTYGNGAGLYEPGANYSSVTIGAGTTINATVAFAGGGAGGAINQDLVETSTSSFSNAGTITLSTTGSGIYATPVLLDQGALSLIGSNSGSLSSIQTAGSTSTALFLNSSSGNLAFTNTGSLYAVGSNSAYGLKAVSSSGGNINIANNQGGTITLGPGADAYGVQEHTTGAGTVIFTNAGTISAPGASETVYLTTDAGTIQGVNSGSLSGGQAGIYGNSNTGSITLSNSGTINTPNYGIDAETNGSASVTNTGTLTGSSSGIYAGGSQTSVINAGHITSSYAGIYTATYGNIGPAQIQNTGSVYGGTYGIYAYSDPGIAVTVTNSGTVTSAGTGIFLVNPGTVIDSGSVTGPTAAISVPSGSTVTLQGNAATSGTIIGGATPASTSLLNFNLGIPAADLAAARTQLDAEVAAYAAQNGGAYTFVIDGRSFDISDFLYNGGITDDLIAAINRLYAQTPGFHSLGSTLDNLNTNTAQGAALSNALGNVPDSGLPNALAELSPKALQVFRNIANDNNTFNRSLIDNHLANLRDGLTGFDSSALTVQDSSMDPTLNQVNSHLLAYNPASTPGLISDSEAMFGGMDMKDLKSAQVNTMPTERWSSFISGNVILADLSSNALPDSNYTTGAVTAGVDYRLDEHFTLGALLAYAHTDADLDNRGSSATVDSYTPGIYASYVDGGWYGNGMASYVRNAYTDDRMVDIPGIAGDNHGATSGNQGTANLTGGYEFHKGSFKFGPVASLEYVHLAIQSLQEQGPTSLTIDNQNEDSLRSLIGFEGRFVADIHTPMGPMSLTPHLSASWQHEYMDNSQGITSQFTDAGGGSFSVQTDSPERDSVFIDVGLDAKVSKNVTLFVDYETQAGQSNFFAQSAQGGVKIGF